MRVARVGSVIASIAVLVAACGGAAAPSGGTAAPSGGTAAPSGGTAAPSVEPSTAVTSGPPVSLTIESWRSEDLSQWRDQIIPAFEAAHPNIKVTFAPTAPADYDAALKTKLSSNTAGDLIVCRPFDGALSLYNDGYLASLKDLPGLQNFSATALLAWQTDTASDTYCVPTGSAMEGFIYNADILAQLGLTPPTTQAEFLSVLQAIKQNGKYAPLALGTHDQWEAGFLYETIGPNYWHGEDGRLAVIHGTAKYTDQPYVDAFKSLASWNPYLPAGFQSETYPDSQNLFTLGKAAIYPGGSWEIPGFEKQAKFKMGFFKPPVTNAGDQCYIVNHPDNAIGMNAKTAHPAEAKQFLEWLTTAEFASVAGNALPGFFPMSNYNTPLTDPLANQFAQAAKDCKTTIRMSYQFLSRGTPNLTTQLYAGIGAGVVAGTLSPEAAAKQIQDGLDGWFKPMP